MADGRPPRVATVGVAEHGNAAVLVTVARHAAGRCAGTTASSISRRGAAAALGREDVEGVLHAMGRSIGPPWQAGHKLAAAAALAAAGQWAFDTDVTR